MTSIRIPRPWEIPERLATPESTFFDRRQVLKALGLGTLALSVPQIACASPDAMTSSAAADPSAKTRAALGDRFASLFPAKRNTGYTLRGRPLTAEEIAASYNNFYEFTTDKERVWELAQGYSVEPWKIEVGGMVEKEQTLDLDALFKIAPLEERLYRHRCVERWAMQVPWTGYPLAALIDALKPLGKAKYIKLTSFLDKKGLPGQRNASYYPWPYYESLRLDEARHPLAFVALGVYGHALPMQHGAPWRLAIPWKYGYKGPKCVVRIEFTDKRPRTFWNDLQPLEYGFYSNIDPKKPHLRWSQARETDIGTRKTRATELFNGYGDLVGDLYDGSEV